MSVKNSLMLARWSHLQLWFSLHHKANSFNELQAGKQTTLSDCWCRCFPCSQVDKLQADWIKSCCCSDLPVRVPLVTGPHADKMTAVTQSDHLDPVMLFFEKRSLLKIISMRRAGSLETSPDSITASQRLKGQNCSEKSFDWVRQMLKMWWSTDETKANRIRAFRFPFFFFFFGDRL